MLPISDDTIKLKPNAGKIADIEPVKTALEKDAISIRIVQSYPRLKLKLIIHYIRQFFRLGFVKKSLHQNGFSHRSSQSISRCALLSCQLSKNQCRHQAYVLSNDKNISRASRHAGPESFSSIDFCGGSLQAPLRPESPTRFAIFASNGVAMRAFTNDWGLNSAENG